MSKLWGYFLRLFKFTQTTGLPRPTERFETLKLLETYITTAIATLIELVWFLITRLLCILQPFNDLERGKTESAARGAMRVNYASRPPQLSFVSAIRLGHLLLALVCVVAFLGNVLAVGLGGLFHEEIVRKPYPIDLRFTHSHEFDFHSQHPFGGQSRQDLVWLSVMTNATLNSRMPPWLVKNYYFQPFAPTKPPSGNLTEILSGRTRGYGMDIACEKMTASRRIEGNLTTDSVDFQSAKGLEGHPSRCRRAKNLIWHTRNNLDGSIAMEAINLVCGGISFVYWARHEGDVTSDEEIRCFSCIPTFKTAMLDVSIDIQGHVVSHSKTSDFSDGLGYENSRNDMQKLISISTENMAAGTNSWHNDCFSHSWPTHTIKGYARPQFLDPSEPLPDPSYVLTLIKDVWTCSFVHMIATPELVNFAQSEPERHFTDTRTVTETRIFMSNAAFIVSAAIFALYIVVAAVLYGFFVKFFLPRMPTSVGAVLQLTAASRAVREDSSDVDSQLRFERCIDLDRRRHVRIEYSELVVPIYSAERRGLGKSDRKLPRWAGEELLPQMAQTILRLYLLLFLMTRMSLSIG